MSLNISSTSKKLHTCPLNLWCDKCAYCQFGYDELKRKSQEAFVQKYQNNFNEILGEKLKACRLELNLLKGNLEEKLKNSADFYTLEIDKIKESLKKNLEDRKEANLSQIDAFINHFSNEFCNEIDKTKSEQTSKFNKLSDKNSLIEILKQNTELIQKYFNNDFKLELSGLRDLDQSEIEIKVRKNTNINTFFWSLADKRTLKKLNLIDIPVYEELKKQNLFIHDVKFIEGGFIAYAFKKNKDERVVSIQIYEVESRKLVKSIEFDYYYRTMIPLPESRLIFLSIETQIELWNLKTMKCISQKIELDYMSAVILLGNKYLISDMELSKKQKQESNASYRTTSIWQICENEIKLEKNIEHISKSGSYPLYLQKVNDAQFMIYLDGFVEIWDVDGKQIKKLQIVEDVKKQRMIKIEIHEKLVLIQTKFSKNRDLGECVLIFCLATGQLLKQFNSTILLGLSPYEFFIQPTNMNENEFHINVHATDDDLEFLGTIDTENFHHRSIDKINFDFNSSVFLFRDLRYLTYLAAVKQFNAEYKGFKKILSDRNRLACGHEGLRRCALCEIDCKMIDEKDEKTLSYNIQKSFQLFEDAKSECVNYLKHEANIAKEELIEFTIEKKIQLEKLAALKQNEINEIVLDFITRLEYREDKNSLSNFECILNKLQMMIENVFSVKFNEENFNLNEIQDLAFKNKNDFKETKIASIEQSWAYYNKHYNINRQQEVLQLDHSYSAVYFPEDKLIVLSELKLTVYNAKDGQVISTHDLDESQVQIIELLHANDRYIVLASYHKILEKLTLHLWVWKSKVFIELKILDGKNIDEFNEFLAKKLAFLENEKIILACPLSSNNKNRSSLELWEINEKGNSKLLLKKQTKQLVAVAALPENKIIAVSEKNAEIMNEKFELLHKLTFNLNGEQRVYFNVQIISDENLLICQGFDEIIYNYKKGEIVKRLNTNAFNCFVSSDLNFFVQVKDNCLTFFDMVHFNTRNEIDSCFPIENIFNIGDIEFLRGKDYVIFNYDGAITIFNFKKEISA